MRSLTLAEIAVRIGAAPPSAAVGSLTIGRVSTDSRTIRQGDLFWALPGERLDGHDYVGHAFAAGAAAAVVQSGFACRVGGAHAQSLLFVNDTLQSLGQFAAWYRTTCSATVVAVTGSVGKTSAREAIYAVLSQRWVGVRSPRNFNNNIGVPLSVLELEPENPFAVIEMGASGLGEISRLVEIAQPQIGVLTSIGAAHLEGFGSLDGVMQGKAELITGLGRRGKAILNADDMRVRKIGEAAKCGVLWYGMNEDPYWLFASARNVTAQEESVSFRLDGGRPIRMAVAGRHQVYAALAAVAVGRWMGLGDRDIAAGLENYRPAAMRCQVERFGNVTVINDAYNANPPSMWAALDTLGAWPATGRRVLVCGDMLELGAAGPDYHRRLGEEIARRPAINCCVAVGPLSAAVVESARKTGMSQQSIVHCETVEQVAELLRRNLRDGDVVLLKASRAIQLERAVSALRKRFAA